MTNKQTNKLEVHFSSNSNNWGTPPELFDFINKHIKFDLDVCASSHNAKVKNYFDEAVDGLSLDWYGRCWMNPPYSRGLQKKWVNKAIDEILECRARSVTMLLPARTDTLLYQDKIIPSLITGDFICYMRGRVKFEKTVSLVDEHGNVCGHQQITDNAAPFPSMLVHINKVGETPINHLPFYELGDVRRF